MAKEIGCKFIETSSGLNHKVDELLVGIVAQVKLNPQRIRNLSEKQRNSLCMAMKEKDKNNETQDLFSLLRWNERNKTNKENRVKNLKDKMKGTSSTSTTSAGTDTTTVLSKESCTMSKGKENEEELEDESDDERSSDEDIEKYLNLDEKGLSSKFQTDSSTSTNIKRLLKSRRYATPGMTTHGVHYGIIDSYFNNNDNNRDIHNSNNNISSSSCSTPITLHPAASSISYQNQINTSKRDSTTTYDRNSSPLSSSQQSTPKKSNFLSDDNDVSNERCINKFSNRTKMFLTSFLKFKRSLRVKRRNSNSCSDLFVI